MEKLATNTHSPRLARPADLLLDGTTACRRAIAVLRNNGLVPIAFRAGLTGWPTVEVAPGPKTAEAIARGEACYYRFTHRERSGHFLDRPCGVRVVWTEPKGGH